MKPSIGDIAQFNFTKFRALAASKQTAQALFFGMMSIEDSTHPMNTNFRGKVAKFLSSIGLNGGAKTLLRRGTFMNPASGENYVELANLYVTEKEPSRAMEVLTAGVTFASYPLQCRNLLALMQAREGKLQEAISLQKQTLETFAYSATAHRTMSEILLLEGKPKEAYPYAIKATQFGVPTADKHYYAASVAAKADQTDYALSQVKTAVYMTLRPKESFLSVSMTYSCKKRSTMNCSRPSVSGCKSGQDPKF